LGNSTTFGSGKIGTVGGSISVNRQSPIGNRQWMVLVFLSM
jgi:hypothetical protein